MNKSVVALFMLVFVARTFGGSAVKTGEIVDPVPSNQYKDQSYAIYLPTKYDPAKKWPILYCFDAGAVGKRPVELFRAAAEKYGYILVGSNVVRANDPTFHIAPSLEAIWNDTHAWFSIDEKRLYASGFSGGARIACALASMNKGHVAGVIGCGAGFPHESPPTKDLPFVYFGTAGNLDFNYQEMMQLNRKLDSLQVPHWIEVFDGRHQWPPEELCTAAIEWMELQAMRKKIRAKEDTMIASFFDQRLQQAQAQESSGRSYEAMLHYQQITNDFLGLKDVSKIQQKALNLRNSAAVKKFIKEQERIDRAETSYQEMAYLAFGKIYARSDSLPIAGEIANELQISDLKRKAARTDNSLETIFARRMLEMLLAQTTFFMPADFIRQKEYRRAILTFTIATKIDSERPGAWYNIAAGYARCGEKIAAIDALLKAVERGFADASAIEKDSDFDSLRNEQAFKELLERIRKEATGSPR